MCGNLTWKTCPSMNRMKAPKCRTLVTKRLADLRTDRLNMLCSFAGRVSTLSLEQNSFALATVASYTSSRHTRRQESTMRGWIMCMRFFRGVIIANRTDSHTMQEVLHLFNGVVLEKTPQIFLPRSRRTDATDERQWLMNRHTDRQPNYSNPRCACTWRVNNWQAMKL